MKVRYALPMAVSLVLAVPALAADTGQPGQMGQSGTSSSGGVSAAPSSKSGQTAAANMMGETTAHNILGKKVQNSGGETLGSVDNLVISPEDGQITHVVLSVGGFLGVGEKKVAVDWNRVHLAGDRLTVDMTRQELQQAQAYQPPQTAAMPGSTGTVRVSVEPSG